MCMWCNAWRRRYMMAITNRTTAGFHELLCGCCHSVVLPLALQHHNEHTSGRFCCRTTATPRYPFPQSLLKCVIDSPPYPLTTCHESSTLACSLPTTLGASQACRPRVPPDSVGHSSERKP